MRAGKEYLGSKEGAVLIAEHGFVYCYPPGATDHPAVCVGTLDQFYHARRRLRRDGWELAPPPKPLRGGKPKKD
jgi:hypothetical protein